MIIKTLIITVVLVAIVMLALGIKMLFNKNAKFTVHSCSLENEGIDSDGACYKCHFKNLADCPEVKEDKI